MVGAMKTVEGPVALETSEVGWIWCGLMTRHGVPAESEIRVYTDKWPEPAVALLLRNTAPEAGRRPTSLANAYSVEHGIVYRPGADTRAGVGAILSEILSERPRWEGLSLSELDPLDPSYRAAVRSLRRAGLFVECAFDSGTWYEETAALSFADYVCRTPIGTAQHLAPKTTKGRPEPTACRKRSLRTLQELSRHRRLSDDLCGELEAGRALPRVHSGADPACR